MDAQQAGRNKAILQTVKASVGRKCRGRMTVTPGPYVVR